MKDPSIGTPHQLFSQSARYSAPVFQRLYVWEKKQLHLLLEDITTGEPKSPQFLGAIVLKDLGRTKGPTSPTSYLLIDGQQRLTTLYLILGGLAKLAFEHGDKNSAEYIQNEYLAEVKSPDFQGQPKLVPTLQDRDNLWEILETSFPNVPWDFKSFPGDRKPAPKLEKQWNSILEALKEVIIDNENKLVKNEFKRILSGVQSGLNFVVITLDEEDDANVIFTKLNAEGVDLNLADLVRNEVFSKYDSNDARKAEKFYNVKWHPFEKSFENLKVLSSFFPVYSYIKFKGKITQAAAFPELQKSWKKESPNDIISDLEIYAPFFRQLSGIEKPNSKNSINIMIDRFARMPRTTVTWPYIIMLLKSATDNNDEKNVVVCLKIVESFLVRRSLSGIEPTGLHAIFKGLWHVAANDPNILIGKITTRTIKSPSTKELNNILLTEPSDTRIILRYVLQEYERDYRLKIKADAITQTVATIEHIHPKKRGSKIKVNEAKQHDALVGLIGNLTALSEPQNKSAKDELWSEKKKRYKGSNFLTTQKISQFEEWNENKIKARTKEIAEWIETRWPPLEKFIE